MQKIFTKRERIIFYITIGIVIFSMLFNFLIVPVSKKTDTLNKEININKIKLKKYIYLLSQKDYLQNKYNEFVSKVNVSGTTKDSLVSALAELETFAKNSNVRIIDVRPQPPRELDSYREVRIDLKTEGTMESYVKFIYNIENSLSLLRIKRFQLNAKPNTQILEGSFSILQLSLVQ